jgi:hypothetical protein
LATTRRRRLQLVQGGPEKVGEGPGRLAGGRAPGLGLDQVAADPRHQPRVPGQAEEIVDPLGLTPGHEVLAREARVRPQQNAHPRPTGPDPRHDPLDLFQRPCRGVDVRAPQLGRQQVPAAEDIKRQVAVVVTVEEAPFLIAVNGIVGGVQVEHDALGRPPLGLQEQVHEEVLDRRRIVADLVVAARRAPRMARLEPAGKQRHHRIVAQLVVVVHVLVAQRDPDHPLAHHRADLMNHLARRASILETRRKAIDQAKRPIRRPKQQRAGLRAHSPTVEGRNHRTALNPGKTEQVNRTGLRYTLSASGTSSAIG